MLDRLEAFLDEHGLGSGPVRVEPDRRRRRLELLLPARARRRALRPAPAPAAAAARPRRTTWCARRGSSSRSRRTGSGCRRSVAVCEDERVLGVPFYVMGFLDGHVVTTRAAAGARGPRGPAPARRRPRRRARRDPRRRRRRARARRRSSAPGSYLERQVRRFSQLWEVNRRASCPRSSRSAAGSRRTCPSRCRDRRPRRLPARQHDGRRATARPRIAAVLDWEMGADRRPARRRRLPARDVQRARRRVEPARRLARSTATRGLPDEGASSSSATSSGAAATSSRSRWFQALALWKAAVFCEAIYGRFMRGELAAEDARAARFETGVPLMAETAAAVLG